VQFHIHTFGAGPPVLLLHGTPSAAADWFPLAEVLAPRHLVLVPELPGYGRSPAPVDARYEMTDQLLADELAARGVRQLHAIAGFSSGAYRAFELVLRGRLEAAHIISLGGVANLDEPARAVRRDLARLLETDEAALHGETTRGVMDAMMLSPGWLAAHPQDRARVLSWLDLTRARPLAAELHALADMSDLRPELPRLAARVYLRVGELDVACPPAASEEIQRLCPRATLDVVPGCAHALLVEDLAGTIAAVVRELEA
jgi:3-oxoadipate enol-lactonase